LTVAVIDYPYWFIEDVCLHIIHTLWS